jgi:hypothetical protein
MDCGSLGKPHHYWGFAELCSGVPTDALNEVKDEKWILSPVRLPVSPPGRRQSP